MSVAIYMLDMIGCVLIVARVPVRRASTYQNATITFCISKNIFFKTQSCHISDFDVLSTFCEGKKRGQSKKQREQWRRERAREKTEKEMVLRCCFSPEKKPRISPTKSSNFLFRSSGFGFMCQRPKFLLIHRRTYRRIVRNHHTLTSI